MATESPEYFLKVENPTAFRKTLLEASKDSIEGLKNYERFREIRTRKIELIIMLVEIVKDMVLLLDRLKDDLPTKQIRAAKKEEKTISIAKKRIVKRAKKAKEIKERTTSPRLQSELDEIEERLRSLG